MKKIIIGIMLLGFCACIFSSFMIARAKVKVNEPSFMITKTKDLNLRETRKLVDKADLSKNYYWKFTIQRTYHASKYGIYITNDTLSREIKQEVSN